jgi:uncharacterized protein
MQVIDMDSHLREAYVLDQVYRFEGKFAEYTPVRLNNAFDVRAKYRHRFQPWPKEVMQNFNHDFVYDPSQNWNGGGVAERQKGGYDMARRVADNEREGIDIQLMFPTWIHIPTYTEGELGHAACIAYNNWVKGLVKGYEEKLWPIGVLPWGHPEALVDELRRCVKELGFKAIHLTPYSHKYTIDQAVLEPFYAEAEKLDVPLLLHPNSYGDLINRYDNFFAMHVLGRPFNCTAGLVALVTGGIFERYPKLRVAFFECSAEWILYWMQRMDDDYGRMRNGMTPKIAMKPSDYVKRNCYVTCEADEKRLPLALAEFNEDHVLVASDYPHFDSEYPGTIHELKERGDISPKQKEKILSINPKEFLRV